MSQTYNWPRFWISQTELLDLSDAGFLRDPEGRYYGDGPLRTLKQLQRIPALALLGEPGIGKSSTLEKESQRIAALPPEAKAVSIYVNLNGYSDENRLHRRLFETPEIENWKAGDAHLYMHLDSLDEAMLRIETVPHLIAEGLQDLPVGRLSVRITCRTAVWPNAILGPALNRVAGEVGARVLELAPLRRKDVIAALSANEIDPEEFLTRLFATQAVSFAIKPLTLRMLITLYKQAGDLPTSVGDLYRKGCLALCEEQNDSRRVTGRRGRLNGSQRLRLAGRIAVATIVGNRFAIWTGSETDAPIMDVPVSRLAGSPEKGDFTDFTAADADIREVLDTGLFTARGADQMGWAHHSYAEFLAADYLIEKGVSPRSILKTIAHPKGGLIPPLANVGAWAASLSPNVRHSLIATDPWIMVRGDLTTWGANDLANLVGSLLAWVEAGKFHDYFFGIFETYRHLLHPNLAPQLKAIIVDRTKSPFTRHTALNIVERTKLNALQPELVTIAEDRTDSPVVRAAAISALKWLEDDSIPPRVLALLESDFGTDPDSEIRGAGLDLLWPKHITAERLFPLVITSDDYHVGSYANFLFALPETLGTQDLPAALAWATDYIRRSSLMNEFRDKTLADAIMFRAWNHISNSSLTEPIMNHIAARLDKHGQFIRGSDMSAKEGFLERFHRNASHRRAFVRQLCRRELDRVAVMPYIQNGFLGKDDLEWLLQVAPGGSAYDSSLFEKSIYSFISWLFDEEENDQYELVYPAFENWPLLHHSYSYLIDGVLIDSAAAAQLKELERQRREWTETRRPPAVADVAGEIEKCLIRAGDGDWTAWCWLNLFLMYAPGSPVLSETANYFLTETPGWAAATQSTRDRIRQTALTYLQTASSSVDEWFGHNPKQMKSNDLSAFRALVLLYQLAPEIYAALRTEIWEKWARVVLGLDLSIGGEPRAELSEIKRSALKKAPDAFIAGVRDLIAAEKARARVPADARGKLLVHPFFVLKDVEELLDDQRLKQALLDETHATDVLPEEYAAILTTLLKVGFAPALAEGVAHVANFAESDVAIIEALWNHSASSIWPQLWQKLSSSDELAKSLLSKLAGSNFHSSGPYRDLSPDQLGGLYLLMLRLFPGDEEMHSASGLVTPHQMTIAFRDGIVRYLVSLGSEDAVKALMRLAVARPDIPMLPFELSRCELEMRSKTWSPLTSKEVFALTDRQNAQLVVSPEDLLELLVEALDDFVAEVHGIQTPVRGLWDRQGTSRLFRPIDENGLSDAVTIYLRQRLHLRGVVANREVEITRQPGTPVGQRTDILINAFRVGEDGQPRDPISAVIEVKGFWNRELRFALNDQLVQDYMVAARAPIGIFLVGWFDPTDWDPDDSRRNAVLRAGLAETRAELGRQAGEVPDGFKVRSIIMEFKTPGI